MGVILVLSNFTLWCAKLEAKIGSDQYNYFRLASCYVFHATQSESIQITSHKPWLHWTTVRLNSRQFSMSFVESLPEIRLHGNLKQEGSPHCRSDDKMAETEKAHQISHTGIGITFRYRVLNAFFKKRGQLAHYLWAQNWSQAMQHQQPTSSWLFDAKLSSREVVLQFSFCLKLVHLAIRWNNVPSTLQL